MFSPDALHEAATRFGFIRRGRRNWTRRVVDFIQLVNLQNSAWSSHDTYTNFALWPLALGEPPIIAESKFLFRTRAEDLGATEPDALFRAVDRLHTLADLRIALGAHELTGMLGWQLRDLLGSEAITPASQR